MKGLLSTFVVSVLVFTGILKLGFYKGFLETGTDLVLKYGKYTCHYSKLHCWSAGNGCELGYSSSTVKTLYNQTSCHPIDNLILTGFYL